MGILGADRTKASFCPKRRRQSTAAFSLVSKLMVSCSIVLSAQLTQNPWQLYCVRCFVPYGLFQTTQQAFTEPTPNLVSQYR
jgi:hypothetical protein